MALQTSGPISLADIQTEFGGSNPISISEYYGAAAGIPASGEISIQDFYGASAGTEYTMYVGRSAIEIKTCSPFDIWGYPAGGGSCVTAGTLSSTTYNGATINGIYSYNNPSTGFQIWLSGNRSVSFFSSIELDGFTLYTSALTDAGTDPDPTPAQGRYYNSGNNQTVYVWSSSSQSVPNLSNDYQTNETVTIS